MFEFKINSKWLLLLLCLFTITFCLVSKAGAPRMAMAAEKPEWLQKIKAMAANWREPITEWPGPTKPISKIPKGKSFVVIPCAMAAEGCKVQAEGFVEAATAVGWKTTLIDGKGDPTEQNNAIQQAIVLGVDGVYMVSVDPDIVWGSLQDATEAGLIMMAGATGTDKGLVHEVSLHGAIEGEMVAAQVIDMTDGDARIALFTGNEFKTCVNRVTGIKRVLGMCPTCKIVVEIDIPVTSIGQELVSRVESTLQAHPDVNVVIAPYDGAANDMVQAIKQASLQDKVWVASFNGNARNLDFIRNNEVQRVDIGEALAWEGWAGVDNFLRIFNSMGPVDDDGVPARILVKGNLPPPGTAWEGDYDFRAKYRELWGLAK